MSAPTTTQTTHAIILAAGFGSRLSPEEGHKLLVEIGGRSLLDHHMANFGRLGVRHITVVTGYRNEALEAQLAAKSTPHGIALSAAYNPDFETSNGVSVLAGVDAAIAQLGGQEALPFWLTMSDHVFDPALFDRLRTGFTALEQTAVDGMLGVDYKLDTIFDMPDANKVSCPDGTFGDIGKGLQAFDMIDVGLFWCAEGFVEALRAEKAHRGDCNTSDAVRRLSAAGRFSFWDVGEHLWQDVDTPEARAHAGKLVAGWDK